MQAMDSYSSLQQAFWRDIRLPRHLLLTPGWYSRFWWRVDDEGLNCTVEERESVLPSSLAGLNFIFLDEVADVNLTTSTGIVSQLHIVENLCVIGTALACRQVGSSYLRRCNI